MRGKKTARTTAIACGGTGGHLFPGLAVAEALLDRDSDCLLLVSAKEIDQQAVQSSPFETITLPAVGLEPGRRLRFLLTFFQSLRICHREFRRRQLNAVLAMGGFTSAAPVLAGRANRIPVFLHESNAVPGRAIRWLGRLASEIFIGFPGATRGLPRHRVLLTGTPVRRQLTQTDSAAARAALGLDPHQPVLLVMGGSQGASAINRLLRQCLPELAARVPELQFIHLSGLAERDVLREAYRGHGRRAVVFPFLTEMELALGAATLAVSRAGASSLAEFAALELPAILLPYPAAADNHQFYNARAYLETGAARQLDQTSATPGHLARWIIDLVRDQRVREAMRAALRRWQKPDSAGQIAARMAQRMPLVPGPIESRPRAVEPKSWPEQNESRIAHG